MTDLDLLVQFSKSLNDKTLALAEMIREQKLWNPSVGLSSLPGDEEENKITQARQDICLLAEDIAAKARGPRGCLIDLAFQVVGHIPLQAVFEFNIAKAVPKEGGISYFNLSRAVEESSGHHVPASDLRSLLRLAMTYDIFMEPQPDFVAHSESSLLIAEDESIASWIGLFTKDLLIPVGHTIAAMKRWPGSQEMEQTGVVLSSECKRTFFEQIESDTTKAKRYELAMKAHNSDEGFSTSHTVHGYPWAELGNATVVDMGGNEGHIAVAIAKRFSALSFIVQDLPGLRAEQIIEGKIPAEMGERVKLTTHDFTNEQPVMAEAYFFRHVLHAFSDKKVLQILRALVPAMRKGTRVIINDLVLPQPGSIVLKQERTMRLMDVLMKTVCNGKERAADDWKGLIERADERFMWKGVQRSSGHLSFMEAVWDE